MKQRILFHLRRTLAFWLVLAAVMLVFNLAFGQPEGGAILVPANPDFNLLFLVPAFLGWLPHWLIKYSANRTTTPSLKDYLWNNLGATITGVIGAVTLVTGMFALNPVAFASFNGGSFLMVLTAAWAADTVNSNFSGKNKPAGTT